MIKIKKFSIYLSIFSLVSLIILYSVIDYFSRGLPDLNEVINYKPKSISKVYDRTDNYLGFFFSERRHYTPIENIPEIVKFAFLSAEDKNFYDHAGYDIFGFAKAILGSLSGKKLRGASTITQQIAKAFLLSGDRTFERKIKELILAVRLEKAMSKDTLLEVYLNEIYLGNGFYDPYVKKICLLYLFLVRLFLL